MFKIDGLQYLVKQNCVCEIQVLHPITIHKFHLVTSMVQDCLILLLHCLVFPKYKIQLGLLDEAILIECKLLSLMGPTK